MLTDRVEIDDAYIGGERTGGKVGRGAAGKTPFVAAVQTYVDGLPQRIVLREGSGFSNKQIDAFAKKKLKCAANVYF
ncbi:transposase [Granulosicoccus sp.]|nr:transposase [Granulosicoccus sp.]